MVLVEQKVGYLTSIYESPPSIPYDAREIIGRVFELLDPHNIYRDTCFELYERAIGTSRYVIPPPKMATDSWNHAGELINHLISVEETRITDQASWQRLKKILITQI